MPHQLRQEPHSETGLNLAQAWQMAPAALAIVEPGSVLACNRACAELLAEAIPGEGFGQRRWLLAAVVRLLAAGQTREVLAVPGKAGSLEICLGPVTTPDTAHVVSLRRATGEAAGQESLAATVSTLSHELRTPLASMKSSLGLVLDGETGPVSSDQAHFLGMTMRNINRLERLVSDLLDISGQERKVGSAGSAEIDLGPVLRDALQMQATAAAEKGLDFDCSGLPDELRACLDPDKVTQILTNIVGNAVKYTPPGGLVRVWAEMAPRATAARSPWSEPLLAESGVSRPAFGLVVADNGPGLSEEDQQRIFEPWVRGSAEDDSQIPGAGLGLSITQALVATVGGRIGLLSKPGQGTTVWLQLPRGPAPGSEPASK